MGENVYFVYQVMYGTIPAVWTNHCKESVR